MEKQKAISLLLARNISPTRQRIEIAQLLFAQYQHICAEQVLNALQLEGRARVSKATVYNTLNLFSREGLLRALCVEAGKVYYDTNTSEHHHIYNIDTGEIWDVEGESSQSMQPVHLPEGTLSAGVEVIYRVRSNPIDPSGC